MYEQKQKPNQNKTTYKQINKTKAKKKQNIQTKTFAKGSFLAVECVSTFHVGGSKNIGFQEKNVVYFKYLLMEGVKFDVKQYQCGLYGWGKINPKTTRETR